MIKKFVLDTSVIVTDPRCLESFPNAEIIIQIGVLAELDKIKKYPSEIGKHARLFIRLLDNLSEHGDLISGIQLDNNSILTVVSNTIINTELGDPLYVDNKILSCASNLKEKYPEDEIILVSRDINLRIRARALGLIAQDHDDKKFPSNEFYSGIKRIENEELGNRLIQDKHLVCNDYLNNCLLPNECVCFTNKNKIISLGRRKGDDIIQICKNSPWGLKPKNIEQSFAIDLMMDTSIPLTTLSGVAGCGKTLLALSCALELTLSQKKYNSIVIYRPMIAIGQEIGYLPGNLSDKIDPWFQAITDGLDMLNKDQWRKKLSQYIDKISFEPITYCRGRSINKSFIIVDEFQNITPKESKTIISRLHESSKIVLTGDMQQIDNSKLDMENNGLTYVINRLKSSELTSHITLNKVERGPLAELAATML